MRGVARPGPRRQPGARLWSKEEQLPGARQEQRPAGGPLEVISEGKDEGGGGGVVQRAALPRGRQAIDPSAEGRDVGRQASGGGRSSLLAPTMLDSGQGPEELTEAKIRTYSCSTEER